MNTENKKAKQNSKINEHIFDLENTLSINLEYISNFIPIMNVKQDKKRKLMSNFEKIVKYFKLKKSLREGINEINGKILINKQIIEETRRRNEENYLYYKDQIIELTDNVNKKSSLVKQIQKKFNEVEIYIQRELKIQKILINMVIGLHLQLFLL